MAISVYLTGKGRSSRHNNHKNLKLFKIDIVCLAKYAFSWMLEEFELFDEINEWSKQRCKEFYVSLKVVSTYVDDFS